MQTTERKEKYRFICQQYDYIPLFLQAWWIDAVCIDKDWDVLLYEENDTITAFFVYHFIDKFHFRFILQPQLSQYSGIWIDYPASSSPSERLKLEKKIMTYFITELGKRKFSYLDLNFGPYVTNWLPFYWNKFKQTTRYSYQIKDLSDKNKLFESFSHAKRKQINKAQKTLSVDYSLSGESFYRLLEKNFKDGVTFKREFFLHLHKTALSRNQGQIIAIKDKEDVHAALFIVWDDHTTYALVSAIEPRFRSSGASSLMFWEAIKFSKTKVFDFEGSMDMDIENSFSQFGTEQIPYFNITKSNSNVASFMIWLKH